MCRVLLLKPVTPSREITGCDHARLSRMASSDYDITNYLRELTLTGVTLLNKDLGRGAYGRVFTVSYQGITYAAKEIHSLLIDYANQEEKQTIKRNFLRECYYCSKATPNKFPVSRPELMQNSMRAGGPFPLFHYFLSGSETS